MELRTVLLNHHTSSCRAPDIIQLELFNHQVEIHVVCIHTPGGAQGHSKQVGAHNYAHS